ncbi:MAG: class I SAM-dependent methyltransferase [Nitrolancea sp.]
MADSKFDPVAYKEAQHSQWNNDASGWDRWGATIDRWFSDVTRSMFDFAGVHPGCRVLDIASGAGEPALSAAESVGPNGYVLATDLSEAMVEHVRRRVAERGLTNVEVRQMDGEQLPLSADEFDVVLCRVGLMLFPNPNRALSEWRRVLRRGGRVVAVVFTEPERNAWGSVPMRIIRERARVPPPRQGQPGIFSLSGEEQLRERMREAGYRSVDTRVESNPLRMQSSKEFGQFAREAFGGFNSVMMHLSKEERDAVWNDVALAMKQFEDGEGFSAPSEVLIACAEK